MGGVWCCPKYQGRGKSGRIPLGEGYADQALWVCGEDDITQAFLRSFVVTPLVITTKDLRYPMVDYACNEAGGDRPILYNVG